MRVKRAAPAEMYCPSCDSHYLVEDGDTAAARTAHRWERHGGASGTETTRAAMIAEAAIGVRRYRRRRWFTRAPKPRM